MHCENSEVQIAVFSDKKTCFEAGNLCKDLLSIYLQQGANKNLQNLTFLFQSDDVTENHQYYNREEKSLRHIAMVAKFLDVNINIIFRRSPCRHHHRWFCCHPEMVLPW